MIRKFGSALKSAWRARSLTVDPLESLRFFLDPGVPGDRKSFLFKADGFRFRARRCDWFGVNEILLDGEYDNALAALLPSKAPALVVDIGANIGAFALRVFSSNPQSTVHSVEPSESAFEMLETNRNLNPRLKWVLHRFAAWNADGEVPFLENPAASTAGFVDPSAAARVPAVSLGTLHGLIGSAPIDLMKIDIEGAEENVLAGGAEVLDYTRSLILEIHPQRCDPARIIGLLRSKYHNIWELTGRKSSKPLLAASRLADSIAGARRLE